MSTDIARTPIRWDTSDPTAWLADMRGETQRHRDALTAQWPSDMRIGYMPNSGVVHMVPADEPFTSWPGVVALCGTTFHGLVRTERVEAKPCTLCTTAYNNGATTGIKPDPFPLGTEVQFEALIGSASHTVTGTVVPREGAPEFKDYRRVEVREGLHVEVRVESLTAVG